MTRGWSGSVLSVTWHVPLVRIHRAVGYRYVHFRECTSHFDRFKKHNKQERIWNGTDSPSLPDLTKTWERP